jgi:protein-tyrosine phosphatase
MRTFDSARVATVDSRNGSVLVRGPFPITSDGAFAYSGILQKIGTSPSFSSVVCISLIDCTGEHDMLRAEEEAFGLPDLWPPSYWPPFTQPGYASKVVHGDSVLAEDGQRYPGGLVWWPIEGLAHDQDPSQLMGWPGYNFSALVDFVHDLVSAPASRIIYFHCSLGADRTGALAGGYAMRYMGMDFSRALDFVSRATPAGSPNEDYVRLLEEFWLHEAVRRSIAP